MQLELNQSYKFSDFADDTVRVLYDCGDAYVVISLLKQSSLPYFVSKDEINESNTIIDDAHPVSYGVDASDNQKQVAIRNYELIKKLVEDEPNCYIKKHRSSFIKSQSERTGFGRFQIQRILCRYWSRGKSIYALYPDSDKCGAPGKERITKNKLGRHVVFINDNDRIRIGNKEREIIQSVIKKYYNRNDKKHTLHNCYIKMLHEHYTDETTGKLFNSYPTEVQFKYHASKYVDQRKRIGHIIYDKDMRGITGSSRSEADGPGDTYQIDATVADIYLVSRDDRRSLVGRPTLYFVLDTFSHMVTGFYCSLGFPSWENAKLALLCSFSEKQTICKRYDIEIKPEEWPCCGLPRSLIVDNGELISKASDSIIEHLGIDVKNEPAWRPDLKGIVESSFRLLNLDVKSDLPGGVYPDFSLRTGRDYRYDAKLTLDEFNKIIIRHILGYNKRVMNTDINLEPDIRVAGIPPIPIELWTWGSIYRTATLKKASEKDLEVALSTKGSATVTANGIKFHGIYYECDTAIAEKWFDNARTNGSWKVKIGYFPYDMSRIFLLTRYDDYEICYQTAASVNLFESLSLEEIDWNLRVRKQILASLDRYNNQNQIDTHAEIEKIIKTAEEKSKNTVVIPFRTDKMKEKRKREREARESEKREHLEVDVPAVKESVNPTESDELKIFSPYDLMVKKLMNQKDDDK